jgi:hypothetical protein
MCHSSRSLRNLSRKRSPRTRRHHRSADRQAPTNGDRISLRCRPIGAHAEQVGENRDLDDAGRCHQVGDGHRSGRRCRGWWPHRAGGGCTRSGRNGRHRRCRGLHRWRPEQRVPAGAAAWRYRPWWRPKPPEPQGVKSVARTISTGFRRSATARSRTGHRRPRRADAGWSGRCR